MVDVRLRPGGRFRNGRDRARLRRRRGELAGALAAGRPPRADMSTTTDHFLTMALRSTSAAVTDHGRDGRPVHHTCPVYGNFPLMTIWTLPRSARSWRMVQPVMPRADARDGKKHAIR